MMVNLFLIEDAGCSHCTMRRLCHSFSSQIQLYCHTGSGDVIDFIRRSGNYDFLPKPDMFIINYHLSGFHHAALTATIRSMPDIADCRIVLCSSTTPDPDLLARDTRLNALKKLGPVDDFLHTPLQSGDLSRLLERQPH